MASRKVDSGDSGERRLNNPGRCLIALEPRMMFDAAGVVTAIDTISVNSLGLSDPLSLSAFLNPVLADRSDAALGIGVIASEHVNAPADGGRSTAASGGAVTAGGEARNGMLDSTDAEREDPSLPAASAEQRQGNMRAEASPEASLIAAFAPARNADTAFASDAALSRMIAVPAETDRDVTTQRDRISENEALNPETLLTVAEREPTGDKQIIVIDTSVVGYEALAGEWQGRGRIILIDSGQDGLAQLRAALAGESQIDALHIVSHGADGVLFLGTTRIDAAGVRGALSAALADIGARLSQAGDLLLYGCDIGAGASGQALLDALFTATGSDVAASMDDTGFIMRGGDWTLENRLGVIDNATLVASSWEGLLAPAVIRIDPATTVLRVFNSAGVEVSNSSTGTGFSIAVGASRSIGVGTGGFAVWSNAGTVNGQAVDLRAVVVSSTANGASADVMRFDRPTAASNDPGFLLQSSAGTGTASIQIRWELVLAGTNTPVAADISYTIADLDGTGANPAVPTRESLVVDTATLSSFQSAGVTDVRFITNVAGQVTAFGTQNELAAPPVPISAARFNWLNTTNWTITYNLDRTGSAQAGFSHDGNSDFNFGVGGVTTSIPRIDLDSNNSTAPGSAYLGSYVENGPGVKIVDTDITLANPLGTIQTATVTLTNAQAGDQLLVNGSTAATGTLPGGITYTISGNVVSFSGVANANQYQNALQTITFRNTTERPATVDRNFTIGFSNGTFASNNAISTIRVTEVNDLPTAVNDPARTTPEDTPITNINALANDTDVDDTLTVTAATATNGTVTINPDGTLNYTPNINFVGTDTIRYTVSDGRGGTSTATVPITITAVNDAPTPVGTLPPRANVDGAAGISVPTAAAFADVDGPSATYSAVGLPDGLSINTTTGVITGTINRSASQTNGGVYNVVVTRSDGTLSATQSFSWTVTNPPPVAVNDAALVVNEDTAGTTVNVLTNDSDPDGDPLTVTSATATNGTVVVNANGTLTFTPNANYNGPATITYTISDGQGGTATATVPVTVNAVNDAPTRVGTLPPRTNVDAAAGISVATAGGFADVDNATLSYSATGLPPGLSIDANTGLITGTINRSASQGGAGGVYSVVVTARDAAGLTTTQTFSWTVTNPPPVAANDTASTSEDTPIPSINVRANDSDPDADPITVTAASAPNGTVTINPDGTLRYVPNANFNGTDTITYTISDGQGGTASATVTVTVGAVNDAPTPVGALPPQANVDATAGINVPTAGAFTDVDNATLTYSIDPANPLPPGLSIDPATGVISGTLTRDASQGGTGGVYSVRVIATDAAGATAAQTFSWTVTNPPPVAVNDTATTNEDTPVLIPVLPNDSDPDGDPLTIIAAAATVGTATIVGNQVQYTPPANFNGTATITYTISDGNGGTATATITVTVAPVNDVPVAAPIPATNTTDGATISVPVAGSFSDPDGNPLSFSAAGLPPGLTIDPVTGVISGTITPNASQTNGGVYTATITASDGNGGTVTQTVTFNVSNPPPVAANDAASTEEDTPVTIAPLANDRDPDADPLTITTAAAQNGTVVVNSNGTVTYTPNPGFNGTDTITYTISDGNGGTSTATITVAVADVNDVPTTSGSIGNQTNLDSQVINLPVAGAFTDPDGDALTYAAAGLPAGLTINPTTGVISGTIDRSASQVNGGAYAITVTASDGRGGTITQTFNWTVTNPVPGAVNDTATTPEDTPVAIPVLANDVDPDGDPLTVTAASAGNGTVVILPNGTLQYTPNPNFNGTDTIFYTITDSEGGTSTATVNVTVTPVNDRPTTVGLPNQNGDDGATVSISIASAFADPDGDPLTFTATGLPPNLTLDPTTGLITGTLAPETSVNGPYVVTVTATDPSGAQITTSFVYAVQNVPPVATNDTASTPEDTPVRVAVLTNDSDPDGDPLTITSATANNGTVVVNPDGTLTFTPAPNFNGVATVNYTVSDGQGGIATATLTINVGAVNDAPTALPIPNQVSVDGAFYSANAAPFFSDVDGDTLTFSATGLPAGLAIDLVTGVVSGTIDPNASQVNGGVYSITVTATDPSGASVSRTFTGTVTNPAPTATNDTATTAEDTPIPAINVLGNDVDPDGDPLTVTAASAPNGTVTINPDGTLRYVPNPNFNGTDTITYVISDGDGGTSTAVVTVTVTPVNDPPVAVNDVATTNEDQPVTIGVLGNDSDVDGDPLTVTAATSPNGTVVINPDGTISFTPNPNFNGPTTITYTISDGKGGTSTATVNVTVNAVNDAPVANPSSAATPEDTPVNVPVLANDTDVDGDPLTLTAASAPNGTVVVNPDGTVTYTPNANFNGTDTITYTISDGKGGFSTSTVTVTVGAINDAPTASPIAAQIDNDADVVNVPVAGNFSDLDGDTLSFVAVGLPTGLTIDPATGVISGTIDPAASQGGPNADGIYTVTVTASDGNGGTVSQTFSWTVANPPPVASNDTGTTTEDAPVTIPVLANDSDPDADPLTVTSATAPNGTVVINPDGTVTYTPNANFNGTDTITYTISDGQGGTSTATVTVTVNSINDAPVVDTPLPAQNGVDSAPVSIPVTGNFSDLDGDTLTFTATGLPPGLTISPAGVISGTLAPGASQGGPAADGIYTVSVTASDGKGGTVTTTFAYTVTNPAPTAANDVGTTNEDAPVTIAVLANDADPDGDPLTVTSATSPDGTVVINPDGTVTFTPNPNFNGPTTISYTISDGNGGTATATVNVTVVAVNDAPVVDTPIPNQSGVDNAPVSIPVAGNFSDLDADTLSFVATGLPTGLTIDPVTGVISGTIDRNASQVNGGVYSVTVTASDGNGGTVSTTFGYTVTNPGPAAANDVANTAEDTPVTIPGLANDSDPDGDALTVTSATSPDGTVVINPDGTITFTPNANFNGPTTISYTISDGNGGTANATVTVNVAPVNDAPTADPPLAPQTNVDADAVSINVAPSFADLDGDTLTFSATGLPPGGTISAAGVISGPLDNSASQGGPNNDGVYTVVVTASDGNGGSITSTFTWTVANPAPVAANDVATTPEDTPTTITVLANDNDVDGDALTVTSASAPNGTVVINPDGTITYTPDTNFNGTDIITYQISDGEGGTSTATITVTVGPVNDAPATLGLPDQFDIDNSIVSIPLAPAFNDVEGDTLTFSAVGLPAGVSIDPVTGVLFGQIANNASTIGGGVYTVTVTAADGNGGVTSTTFTWTIDNTAPFAADDTASTSEDAPVTFNVLGNDADPDLDPLTVVSATATNGTVVVNADGTLTFTPNADFNGTATVNYLITDGNGGFSTATAVITIAPVNDAPDAAPLPDRANLDGAAVSIPAGAQFSDREGDVLRYSADNLPGGLSIDPNSGLISGTIVPDASQVNGGVYAVTITADDGNGGTTTISFVWTVTNPGPTAVDDVANTTEDNPATIAVLANDTDPDNDPLTVTAASAPNGTVVINPDGTITYTPDANFNGTDTITYAISDGNGGTSTAIVTVNVTAANDAPTVQPLPARANVDGTPITFSVAGNFDDLDGDTLSFTATGLPLGLTMDAAGVITGSILPGASQGAPNGIYTVTVTASDGNGGTVTTTFSWTVTNPPPISVNDTASTTEDTPVPIPVLTNDSDPDGDPLTVTAVSAGNGTVAIGAGGVLTYTPAPNFNGTDTITYTISDGNGGTSTATVTVTVGAINDAPTSTAIAPQTNPDNATVTLPVAANFSDVDNPTLQFSAVGLPLGLTIDPNTGVISGTIDRNASQPAGGIYSVTVTATDTGGLTTSQTFSWTVTNPPPVAVNDVATTPEDFPVNINVLANDRDPDGDALTVTTASAGNGTVTILPNGTIDYTPGPNFNGTDTITYTISDGNGGTSTATVTVTVGAQNDPPVAVNDATSTNEDTPVTIAVLSNDSDIDGNPLTVTAATSADGTVVINPDGTIRFTPNPNFNGVATINYTISDGQGGFASATVTVDVNPVNDPPVAVNDTATTPEDTPVTIAVLANDSDVDGDLVAVTSATSPNGAVTINPDGTITFTPTANFNGPTTISYTISDGKGGTSTATVTLTVAPVNDVPVANPSTAATNEDTPVVLTPLANDSDADGDPLTVTAASAANGTVTILPDGTVGYVPNANFNGTDVVTYTISDGKGGTATSTVTVTVNPVNDVPVAVNDNATTPEDSPVTIPLLANDSDADGNPLTVTAATSPNGSVVINPDGTVTFTPNPNFNGPTTITYTISDGQGGTATATIAVNVTPVNDPPVARPDTATTPEDTPVVITPLTNDSDVDGNPLTVTTATAPNGTVTINPDGTIRYVPDANFNGVDTITYTVSDGRGGTSTTTVTVTVTPVNDPPIARNDVFVMDEDTTARIPVLANDNDPDGDPLTVTAASSPNGTVVINPDGTVSFTPNRDFFGPATITYTISDGRGGTATATVTVDVRNANELPVDGDETLSTVGGVINTISVLDNASDPDRDPLTVISAEVDVGTVTINPDGTLNYVAPADFQGVAIITYLVSDGKGGFDRSTVTITVQQAAADMNALIGRRGDEGGDDPARIWTLRDQTAEFITVPLIIDSTANSFRSLNPTPDLNGERPLLTAVNAIRWLKGSADLGDAPVGDVVDQMDRIRDLRFGADRLFDHRFGDFIVRSLTGFSVREIDTGNAQVMINVVVRDRVIWMDVQEVEGTGQPPIIAFRLRTHDGSPLPEWIRMDERGLGILEVPAGTEALRLVVQAVRADGSVLEIPIVVQGATAEIQLDRQSNAVASAQPLSAQLAANAGATDDETSRLMAAFNGMGQ